MANCYLCRYDLVNGDRWPRGVSGLRTQGTPWGSIDLSNDGRGGGKDFCFLATTGTIPAQSGVLSIGTEATPVNASRRTQIGNFLGVTVTGTTVAAVVEQVLVSQGLAVRPDQDGMIRIWLGPVLLVERPA